MADVNRVCAAAPLLTLGRGGAECAPIWAAAASWRKGCATPRGRPPHTLLAPRACRPCEAAYQCVPMPNRMGTGRRPRPLRFPNGRAIRRHPPFVRRAARSASAPRAQPGMHACIGARGARLHRFGETRALSVPAERHGRTARYGRASGTASGAIGGRSPGQPTAVAQSSVVAPARAAIRARVRFACRSGTAWRRPLPAGLHAAPSPQAGSFRAAIWLSESSHKA